MTDLEGLLPFKTDRFARSHAILLVCLTPIGQSVRMLYLLASHSVGRNMIVSAGMYLARGLEYLRTAGHSRVSNSHSFVWIDNLSPTGRLLSLHYRAQTHSYLDT
ncbi:hypothetical protein BD289DRAFT_245009 [Coniella lustricola]|uniref:Uncharacterized protein n=1 Tax=Coniella lustricola TaxID=2025994 RepID=A0A2T3A950_9PEZI|nr:hypothetical protein BD289DRAFT_245009 [Coniella lustricola]